MYKEIIEHRSYVKQKLLGTTSQSERKNLIRYHNRRVRDFQHERLVHLMVTLFFALMFFTAFIIFFVQPFSNLQVPLGLLTLTLFVTELAYLSHYYQLENGVQSLYDLTKKLNQKD